MIWAGSERCIQTGKILHPLAGHSRSLDFGPATGNRRESTATNGWSLDQWHQKTIGAFTQADKEWNTTPIAVSPARSNRLMWNFLCLLTVSSSSGVILLISLIYPRSLPLFWKFFCECTHPGWLTVSLQYGIQSELLSWKKVLNFFLCVTFWQWFSL